MIVLIAIEIACGERTSDDDVDLVWKTVLAEGLFHCRDKRVAVGRARVGWLRRHKLLFSQARTSHLLQSATWGQIIDRFLGRYGRPSYRAKVWRSQAIVLRNHFLDETKPSSLV